MSVARQDVSAAAAGVRRPRSMGYQPGLDGLRAISVIAVILYHAGFSWMPGGFIGVEVFFVVSGFLITSLLLDERHRTGGVDLRSFWTRRARRLLPALFAMLIAVAIWGALAGSAAQTDELRRDLPWAVAYLANWGQILGDVPYFAATDPPLLRHLWSLAVEEQWYLVWPVVFMALAATRLRPGQLGGIVLAAAVGVMVFTGWLSMSDSPVLGGAGGLFDGADRVNFMYLSTVTRSSGLLLGAAAAFVWRPWRSSAARAAPARPFDVAAGVALGVLVCAALATQLTDRSTYQWVLPLVSVASLVAVLAVVHPAAAGTRWAMSQPWLVAVGKRSYGLYLWHWPVFVVLGATAGSVSRFLVAAAVSVVIAEASFRLIETPIRHDGLRSWVERAVPVRAVPAAAASALIAVAALGTFYWNVERFDPAVGGEEAVFERAPATTVASESLLEPAPELELESEPEPVSEGVAPVALAILGDSQAHSLAVNLPDGLAATFAVTNGAIPGCGVYDQGRVRSERTSFNNSFAACAGWQSKWVQSAQGADLALVWLGAWDVFDVEIDGELYPFATAQGDQLFVRSLRSGVDALRAEGVEVALLEVACMRPVQAAGAAVPPLPERADDTRVARLNGLLRQIAAEYSGVSFVEGPDEWCGDEAIATDLGYRWDGVHVWRPGANLIYTTIADELLDLAG